TIGFAANDTGAIDAFVAAAKCDALKNGNFTVTQNGRTYTFTAKSYAHYVQLDNVIDKLDAAIKGLDEYKNNAHHNNNKNCADAWYGGDNCTDLGWVEKYLKLAIGDSELATLNGTYNLEKLFAAVFNMTDMNYRNADTKETDDKDDTESAGNVPDEVTNTLIVTTSKVHDKLLEYSSISAIPNNFALTTTYTLKMFEQNYTTTKTSGCDEVTVNHYHIAMNINKTGGVPSIAVSNGDSQKAVLTSAESVFNSYADYINAADVVGILELSEDEDALAIVKDALVTAKDSVINTHSEDVYNHFFDEVKIAAAIKNIDDAIKFLGFAPTVEELIRLNAVDYSSYTESQLLEHLTAFEKKIAEYDALEAATQNLIIEVYDLDIAAIKATCADVRHDYEVYGIVRLKAQTDTHMAMYAGWNEAMIDEGTVTKAMLTTAVATIANDISQFGNYVQANVVEVCGETYLTTLGEFKVELERLGKIAGLNEAFLYEYAKFRDEIKNAIAEDSETLLESLINYDSWVTDLKALIATMETELGKELANQLFDELNEPMMAYIGNAYTVLRIRTEDEINTAYDLFSAYKKTYGETIVMATVSEYKAFADAIGRINVATYDFLVASPNVEITQDIINKYNELMGVDYGYADFLATYGFSTFQTSTVADIVRKDSADDIARENADTDKDGIGEYVTKDSEIESVIAKIDAALSNAAVKDALGLDLSTMLSDLVSNAIISDSFINTVVDMLYPLVLKEFAKVFENELPQKVTDPITADVNYKMNIHGVLQNTGFEVYPDLLAAVLDKNLYADNIAMLNAAYKNFDKEFGASTGGLSYTTMLDPEGGVKADGTTPRTILDKTAWDSVEIRDENGKLKLTWGVDAAKEAGMAGDELKNFFYDRFDDAVEGLKPLLLALIANKPWNPGEIAEFATASIATVSLKLGATASSGYANLIVPIFEALGISYTNVSVIETEHITKTNDVAAIIKEILGPIFGFVEQIGNAPLNTVLGILPNLCYAL
ncbi:MAG: hypothetical protein II237_05495, partial [Clostridia bacterium]|nr:hypothetical protein [Clostridia bacterium]